MSSLLRRYEILLPRRFNDGRVVPRRLLIDTMLELEDRFGAVSLETQIIRGFWRHKGVSFRDNLARIFVDVPGTQANRRFFIKYKKTLKKRFEQIDIWIITYPVEAL